MTSSGFLQFCEFLKRESGIALETNKEYLVSSRLNRLLAEQNINSLENLVYQLKQPQNRVLKQLVVELMTTNETQWFRDHYPLQTFADEIIPSLVNNGHNSIRIWSAACSSGQEPYSISMVIEEHREMYRHMHLHRPDISIVATDISSQILQKARNGVYDKSEISRGLDVERRQNFFSQKTNTDGQEYWELNTTVKQQVSFQQHNLLDSYAGLGQLDVIFCRNVLIYFSPETKTDILNRMAKQLKPNGYLILGSSETPSNYTDQFRMERCKGTAVYRLKET